MAKVVSRVVCALIIVGLAVSPARAQDAGPLTLDAAQAVSLGLDNNLVLRGARLGPEIAEQDVRGAVSAWSPQVSGRLGAVSREAPPANAFDSASVFSRQFASRFGLVQRLKTGATYDVAWDGTRLSTNNPLARFQPQLAAGVSGGIVQPLLRGLRIDDARAQREVSLLGREAADAEMQSAVAMTTRLVRQSYWTWLHARDYLAVQRESLTFAETLLEGNRRRVEVGALAGVDVIEAQAEVARRREAILTATNVVTDAEERLRALLFQPDDPRYARPLQPDVNATALVTVDGTALQAVSLARRQDLQSLRAAVSIDAVETRLARNERLPDVSLRANYAVQATAGIELLLEQGFTGPVTEQLDRRFTAALRDLAESRYPTWSVDVVLTYPIGQKKADADAARASIQQRRDTLALRAAEQQADLEIRAVQRDVLTNRQRLDLAADATRLAEQRLAAEERKFLAGLSTSFFVFQAQRDLAQTRELQLRSMLDYRLSLADLDAVQVIPLR
jgi:outer membrane protein TolC